ncbi:MAG: hypothetical protein AMXMBFR64_18880 [Myxococcales bacterium]
MSSTVPMTIAGLSIDSTTRTPVLVLREEGGDTVLPIYIGLMEASAIAAQIEGVQLARPMTHDLLKSVLGSLGGKLLRIEVTDLRDNTFFASLFVQQGDRVVEIDSRPSDAIALALRAGAPIHVARHVLALSGSTQAEEPDGPSEDGVEPTEGARTEEGSPRVLFVPEGGPNPGDTEQWRELLEKLAPDDFGKYKM